MWDRTWCSSCERITNLKKNKKHWSVFSSHVYQREQHRYWLNTKTINWMGFSEFVISSENSMHHCCWHSIKMWEAVKTELLFFLFHQPGLPCCASTFGDWTCDDTGHTNRVHLMKTRRVMLVTCKDETHSRSFSTWWRTILNIDRVKLWFFVPMRSFSRWQRRKIRRKTKKQTKPRLAVAAAVASIS